MRLRTSPQYSTTARCRFQRRIAACLLRAVMLVLAAEVSGTLHAALDVAVEAGMVAHPDDDCERNGHECPPGCLSCHCTHAASALTRPACDWIDGELTPRAHNTKHSTYDSRMPSGPERGRIDRPPRPRLS